MLDRALTVYTRLFALWVVLFSGIAYLAPGPFVRLQPGLPWFFALTMFGIGAVLSVDDFRAIARRPLIVLIGSVAQYSVMPFGAFVVAKLLRLPPDLAVGLILTGAAPGAMSSNVVCYLGGADTAYSVSLTTVSTLLCPLLTPGLTWLLAQSYLDVAFWPMFLDVTRTVIAPLAAGLLIKHIWSRPMARLARVFPAISVTFIVFICCLVIALNHQHLSRLTGVVLLAAVLLNVYGLTGGYTVGRVFRLDRRQRRTLCIEIGMQNAGLGTLLALKHFGPRAAMPAAVFVNLCILSASGLVAVWRRLPAPSTRDETTPTL